MSTNGGDQDRERYFQEQAFRLMIVARELGKRVGTAAGAGMLISAANTILAEDLGTETAKKFLEAAIQEGPIWPRPEASA